MEEHTDAVRALAVTPDGTLLASGDSGTIKLWSLPEGALVKTLEGHTDAVRALAVTLDGTLLASGSNDNTIKLWSLPEGEFASCLIDLAANESSVLGMMYRLEAASGQTVEYTLPCGSAIPAGTVCVCNCVAGSLPPLPTRRPPPTPCSCDDHCSCDSFSGGAGHYWYPN